MLCAGSRLSKTICDGDSGGPLVVEKAEGDVLVGVVSWSIDDCRRDLPSVFARVSIAFDLIKRHLLNA
jgi:secreted trypsin-like serine protease